MKKPRFKAFVIARKKIFQVMRIYIDQKYILTDNYKEFKFSEIILLPYWCTVGSKINRFHLHQGDIFQIQILENSHRYIVRYNEKEFCFMIARTDQLQDEKLWKRDIWFRPDRDWWELFQERLVYLGNEYVNPELLEEK